MPKKNIDMGWEELTQKVAAKLNKSNDKKFIEWFKDKEKIGYLFDTNLIRRCYGIHKKLSSDMDSFLVISGKEGFGKSTLGIQIASYISDNFSLNNVCYSASQFIKALREAPPGSTILMDEGGQTLFSRESMSLTNRMLVKTFMIMRQRNLCVIICIPNFHLLDHYIKLHRVDTLLQLSVRGKYFGFLAAGIKKVAVDGSRYKQILGIKVPEGTVWRGYFNKEFPKTISREDYIDEKDKEMIEFLDKLEEDNDFIEIKMIPIGKVAREIMCDKRKFIKLIQKGELEGKKIGNNWYMSKAAYKKLVSSSK